MYPGASTGSSQQWSAGACPVATPWNTSSTPTIQSRFSSSPSDGATRDTAPSAPTTKRARSRSRRPRRTSAAAEPAPDGSSAASEVSGAHSTPARMHPSSARRYSAPMRPTRNSSCGLASSSERPRGEYSATRRTGGPRQSSGSAKLSRVRRTKMPVVCTAWSTLGFRSTRRTRAPPSPSRRAHSSPASPAPTTSTSTGVLAAGAPAPAGTVLDAVVTHPSPCMCGLHRRTRQVLYIIKSSSARHLLPAARTKEAGSAATGPAS